MVPHTFKHIPLHLEPSQGIPEETTRHGYEFVAPPEHQRPHGSGAVAPAPAALPRPQFLKGRRRRAWPAGAQAGRPGACQVVFDYDPDAADDESGYRFGMHAFSPGEYVSLSDDEGELHTFRAVAVKPST